MLFSPSYVCTLSTPTHNTAGNNTCINSLQHAFAYRQLKSLQILNLDNVRHLNVVTIVLHSLYKLQASQ